MCVFRGLVSVMAVITCKRVSLSHTDGITSSKLVEKGKCPGTRKVSMGFECLIGDFFSTRRRVIKDRFG